MSFGHTNNPPNFQSLKFLKLKFYCTVPRAIPEYSVELNMAGIVRMLDGFLVAASDWWRILLLGHMTAVAVRHWLGAAHDRHCHFSLLGCLELILLLLTLFRAKVMWGGGSGDPNFFLHISSSWVKLRLPSEDHLPGLHGSA